MMASSIAHTYKRYQTLRTGHIFTLPIVILMPHSACNCRCVMCDIWKDNKNLKQLTEQDLEGLLDSLRKLGTRQVVMSGGEALLNPNFFKLCEILSREDITVSLLSTGLNLLKHANSLLRWVRDIVVSIDGDEETHNEIRNIPGAFQKLREGVQHLKSLKPDYQITGRTVIHRLNYERWSAILASAKEIRLDQISFLPADVSSQAFNREVTWAEPRQDEILIPEQDLPSFKRTMDAFIEDHASDFKSGLIAESPLKIQNIYRYYTAFYGFNLYPYKRCNAPWVSTVIEPDGNVRPCFFHDVIGNIRKTALHEILNSEAALDFRQTLNMNTNETCVKCVCSLNLSPLAKIG